MIRIKYFILLFFLFVSNSFAANWPGSCYFAGYIIYGTNTTGSTSQARTITFDPSTGTFTTALLGQSVTGYSAVGYASFYFDADTQSWKIASNITGQIYIANTDALLGGHWEPAQSVTSISWLSGRTCTIDCSSKAGTTAGYNIETYTEGSSPNLSDQCVDGCAVSAEVLESLGPCVNSQCVVSLKYTYTGQQCGGEDVPLDEEPPGQCYAQWTALVNKCGGASNVASFDWSSCSGECLKKDCSDKYAELAEVCGGYIYIASWDNTTCQGVCASFSTPNDDNGDAPPSNITTTTQTNSDGSSTVTNTKTYNIDNTTYIETKTTTYDSSGNATGTSTTVTTSGSGSGDNDSDDDDSDEETFDSITPSGLDQAYNPGEFDIPGRFTTFLTNVKSSGLFSFSTSFFNSLPGGGSSTYEIDGGETFGHHSIDLSESLSGGLAVLKTILLAIFGFLSIRAIIMKR